MTFCLLERESPTGSHSGRASCFKALQLPVHNESTERFACPGERSQPHRTLRGFEMTSGTCIDATRSATPYMAGAQ